MSITAWIVNDREIVATHSWWTGVCDLYVDGLHVFHRPSPPLWLDLGFVHRFDVADLPCALRIIPDRFGLLFKKELWVGIDAEAMADADPATRWQEFSYWLGLPLVILLAGVAALAVTEANR